MTLVPLVQGSLVIDYTIVIDYTMNVLPIMLINACSPVLMTLVQGSLVIIIQLIINDQ